MVRVFRNQNACPSSAATTNPFLIVWWSGFTACSCCRRGLGRQQERDRPPGRRDQARDNLLWMRGRWPAGAGCTGDPVGLGAGGQVTPVLFGQGRGDGGVRGHCLLLS